MRTLSTVCLALGLWFSAAAIAFERGVIHDPDGYVNLRKTPSTAASIVTKVKDGEPFDIEQEDEEWAKVKVRSGKTGWMHRSRIKYLFTSDDLSKREDAPDDNTELAHFGRAIGVDYYDVVKRALKGDAAALQQFIGFSEKVDGGAAEGYFSDVIVVAHLQGDEKFAAFLQAQPLDVQLRARYAVVTGQDLTGTKTEYWKRIFPKSSALFFRKEIVGWPSPDGRFAIRKVFSSGEEILPSKVMTSELIEKTSGKVLLKLEDHGTDSDREGAVLWAPDSKRFAHHWVNLSVLDEKESGPRRKMTHVYQDTGNGFTEVKLALDVPADRATDAEVKAASVRHEWIEPVRWSAPNVLVLERHDSFEPPPSLENTGGFDRLYEITVTFREGADPSIEWKTRADRP